MVWIFWLNSSLASIPNKLNILFDLKDHSDFTIDYVLAEQAKNRYRMKQNWAKKSEGNIRAAFFVLFTILMNLFRLIVGKSGSRPTKSN